MQFANHLSAIAGFDREALCRLDAKPPKDISDRPGFRFAYRFEEDPALRIDQADGCFEMSSIKPYPVVLINQTAPPSKPIREAKLTFGRATDRVGIVRTGVIVG